MMKVARSALACWISLSAWSRVSPVRKVCRRLLVGLAALAAASSGPSSGGDWVKPGEFASPPAAGRILKIIHGWLNAASDQQALIERLKRQGFGGVTCNVSFDDYLESAARWQDFERAVKAAHTAGWSMWLYDERGYPSGNAGGLVLRSTLTGKHGGSSSPMPNRASRLKRWRATARRSASNTCRCPTSARVSSTSSARSRALRCRG